jgi:hypothetical protein
LSIRAWPTVTALTVTVGAHYIAVGLLAFVEVAVEARHGVIHRAREFTARTVIAATAAIVALTAITAWRIANTIAVVFAVSIPSIVGL